MKHSRAAGGFTTHKRYWHCQLAWHNTAFLPCCAGHRPLNIQCNMLTQRPACRNVSSKPPEYTANTTQIPQQRPSTTLTHARTATASALAALDLRRLLQVLRNWWLQLVCCFQYKQAVSTRRTAAMLPAHSWRTAASDVLDARPCGCIRPHHCANIAQVSDTHTHTHTHTDTGSSQGRHMRTLPPSNSSNMRAGPQARYEAWDKLASSKLQLQLRAAQQAQMSRTYPSTGAEQGPKS
jgi:hypothetical protein